MYFCWHYSWRETYKLSEQCFPLWTWKKHCLHCWDTWWRQFSMLWFPSPQLKQGCPIPFAGGLYLNSDTAKEWLSLRSSLSHFTFSKHTHGCILDYFIISTNKQPEISNQLHIRNTVNSCHPIYLKDYKALEQS